MKNAPKYSAQLGKIVEIPEEEPIFILRAQDKNAALAIAYYKKLCRNSEHIQRVNGRIHDFVDFAHNNPEKMKEPD